MTMGLLGRKCGMTRVFTDDGASIPVTVIEAHPNRISQVKSQETDGYAAVQVTAGTRKASRVAKPEAGHFARAKVEAGDTVAEFRLDASDGDDYAMGGEVKVDLFEVGQGPLEAAAFGEHADGAGTAELVRHGEGGRVGDLGKRPLGRAGALDLGDDPHPVCGGEGGEGVDCRRPLEGGRFDVGIGAAGPALVRVGYGTG